jgi:hypothetical protein
MYFELSPSSETVQQAFDDMRGIPIPNIGDSVCPGKGQFKIVNRTFAYSPSGLTIYYLCE